MAVTLAWGISPALNRYQAGMDADNIPAFAFHEAPDGTITWGSSWVPGPNAEPVAVEYRQEKPGLWVPFSAWVRERGYITMHNCDWIESSGELYHHESGGGEPYVGGFFAPEKLSGRIWISEGTTVYSADSEHQPLSDADLLSMGIRRVHGPTPAPFEDAMEGGTFHDERSGERLPDDDGELCSCCSEMFAKQRGDLVVLGERDVGKDGVTGLYRPSERTWDHGTWVAPIPATWNREDEEVCPSCAAQALADFALHGLAAAWSADPDVMPSEHREALLDAVRERVDPWIAGYPEVRISKVHAWLVPNLAPRLGLPVAEMHKLCDEAGYG